MTAPRSVLITGGAGNIATRFAERVSGVYDLTLLDLPGRFTEAHAAWGRLVEADLTDLEAVGEAMRGIDTVIHLGGERRPASLWSTLLPVNIVGTYNVVAAAVAAGCRHVIYGSSVHVVTGYEPQLQVRETDPVRPGDLYGVTKCFGEALGAYVAATEGVSFTALRIGAFQDPERLADDRAGWMLRDYCAPEDLFQLLAAVIDADRSGFQIYNAVSGNRFSRLPIDKARAKLDYAPAYDAFEVAAPFRNAIEAVGGVDDGPVASGMREDVERIMSSTGK
ncbi:NAD-dependent epimerase/dehydratase family protein [Agromyces silvae]|uniref:NAD-dependent epimerase/dehydratase family protein n=1 Tax=Agromyces silvae TaxID=3388266 RepID=UPI00280BD7DA|nr:NAD(P)-dependent oxidoreductase [Agromyces protaetiae]